MKIGCDVCNKESASVFCSADEAALCDGCDHRVHHANKLASKHIRFSLRHPSFKDSPPCDICQERRAILFCQEDRAILCRDCDIPIHKANEHTQNHNRFLLTGMKLSVSSSSRPDSPSSNGCDLAADSEIKSSVSNQISNPSSTDHKALPLTRAADHCTNQDNSVSASSISEYLMETLPGWRVDDFLDPSCFPHGFCKFSDRDLESDLYHFPTEDLAICVPQALIQSSHIPLYDHLPQTGMINGQLKGSEESRDVMKISRKWYEDGFTVPQFIVPPPPLKKSRQFW